MGDTGAQQHNSFTHQSHSSGSQQEERKKERRETLLSTPSSIQSWKKVWDAFKKAHSHYTNTNNMLKNTHEERQ